MPCYEVNLMTVEFKAQNLEHLKKALDAMKLRYRVLGDQVIVDNLGTINLKTGRAEIRSGYQGKLNELKREYSKVVIQEVARTKKWAFRTTPVKNKFQLAKY
jgi:hypothetical protein